MGTKAEEYLAAYGEFSKVLRTWFVAYGVGAPVLLITNEAVSTAIKTSGSAKTIGGCFLAGAALQIILATLNKAAMWVLYYGEENQSFKGGNSYKVGYWFSEHISIDLMVDSATLILFGIATWKAFSKLII